MMSAASALLAPFVQVTAAQADTGQTLGTDYIKGNTKYVNEINVIPEFKDNAKYQVQKFNRLDLSTLYADSRLSSQKNRPVFTVFDQDPRKDAPNKLRLTYLNIQQALDSMLYGDDLTKKAKMQASIKPELVMGQGSTVGIIDSAVNVDHKDFANGLKVSPASASVNNKFKKEVDSGEITHGTEVALTAGGKSKKSKFTGIAAGSKIQAYAIDPDNVYLENVFYEVYRDKVSVANASFVLGDDLSFFPTIRDTFYKIFKDPEAPLYVFAAGNKDDESSTFSPLLKRLVQDDTILKNVLVVSGVKPRNSSANLNSLRPQDIVFDPDAISCSEVKYNCLTAFFEYDIPDPKSKGTNSKLVTAYGTSFSAPQVSGAAALVKQMFPWYTADNIRQTLLTTATDIGAPGIDEKTGWGLLNIGAAVYGPAQFAFGDFVVDMSLDHVSRNREVFFFRNNIYGQYGLVVRDRPDSNKQLVMIGDNSYKGITTVDSGFLRLGGLGKPGTITGSVNINADGTFQIVADSKVGSVYNNGFFISASDTEGKGGTITGDFTNSSGGYLFVKAGNPIRVLGNAKLSGALLVNLPEGFKPQPDKGYLILKAKSISGEFTEFKVDGSDLKGEVYYNHSNGEVADRKSVV